MKKLPAFAMLAWLFLLNIPDRSYAQGQRLRFEHFTIEDGFSHVAQHILQDRQGYLWFASNDGLTMYDGYGLTTYKNIPRDSTSLPTNFINILWEDSAGNIWMGTPEEGLCKFDRRTVTFTTYRLPQPKGSSALPFKYVSAIHEDAEGMMWVGNLRGELRRFDRQTGKFSLPYDIDFRPQQEDTQDEILAMCKDRSGALWIGNHTGLHRLNLKPGKAGQPSGVSFIHYQHEPANPNRLGQDRIFTIFEDRKGLLWLGTAGGLSRFDPTSGTFTRYLHDPNNPHSISGDFLWRGIGEDLQGNLWVGTYNSIDKLNPERTQFTRYANEPADPTSLAALQVNCLLVDRAGSLWVGAGGAGIDKVDPVLKPFAPYLPNPSHPRSLLHNGVIGMHEDRTGIVWIATGSGLNAFDPKTGTFTNYLHNPDKPDFLDRIGSVLEDRQGRLWIVNATGKLSLFNRQTKKFSPSSGNAVLDKLLETGLHLVYEDRQGLLWLVTGEGLHSFDSKTGAITSYRHDPANPESISANEVHAICEDSRGNLWVSLYGTGVSRLNKRTGKFIHYRPDRLDSTSIISSVGSIYGDSKGDVWFGNSGAGLCRFDYGKETFATYTEKNGLANNTINSIVEDNDGNLWLGTNKGLSRFSLATHAFTNYDAKDGLQSNLFFGSSCRGRDGTLYFGGSNGFNAFKPRQIQVNRYVPPVVITQFKLFDKVVPGRNEDREIILDYDENFFSFEFAALNYINSRKNRYAYQLAGFDPGWILSGARRYASYTNLDPGEYTFRVKGSNNDGIWNEKGVSVHLVIRPPWWRTWWAYGLYALAFAGSVWGFIYYRSRQLIRENRVLEQKVATRTAEVVRQKEEIQEINEELSQQKEEIATQRDQVSQTLEELKTTQAQLIQKEKMASLGELTAGIAHEIQNPLNFVNNFSEVSGELVEELKEGPFRQLPETEKAYAGEILHDLSQNLSKIHHHGKRADSIVKGMLEHSRSSTGEKQPTDINALADEYLRLAYHGLRAKDKEFNASLLTDLDANLGKVNIVPQEIGRVMLNLFNNAFYATQQKKHQLNGQYQPAVKVSTRKVGDNVEITVKDNGSGMPESVKSKIFQPFFTTKPTGQGTGLGLSLSYDIVTKGHGGELRVESQEGEFAEFVIRLPIR